MSWIIIYLSILSRTYYKSPTTKGNVTNPGEFPWVAAIFDKSEQDQYRSLHIYISTLSMLSKYLHIYTIYAISISIFIHDIYITAGSLSSWAPVRSWTWTPWSRWDTRCSPSSVSHNISSAGHVSRVTCHVSCVMCHVSRVMCHVARQTRGPGGASRGLGPEVRLQQQVRGRGGVSAHRGDTVTSVLQNFQCLHVSRLM